MEAGFDGCIQVRRYLCRSCRRTVSLLPQFALPYLRFGISVIALFLVARLLQGLTLAAAALAASQKAMPYQRGQFWIPRFGKQAERLCAALAALCGPAPASNFVARALAMRESIGWIAAHRFLFADLRMHLFVGGEPKVGKSLLVANLALALAVGQDRAGFTVPAARRVLVCQFELPVAQFVSRLAAMRRPLGAAADQPRGGGRSDRLGSLVFHPRSR